jgi:hypothetical protein
MTDVMCILNLSAKEQQHPGCVCVGGGGGGGRMLPLGDCLVANHRHQGAAVTWALGKCEEESLCH